MPKPTFTALLSSGRISPKRSPLGRPGGGGEEGRSAGIVVVSWERDVEVEACELEATEGLRGLLILLANDCVLADAWSSGTNLGRWVARPPDALPASCAVSLVDGDRKAPYDVAPFPAVGGRPMVLLDPVSRAGRRFVDVFRGDWDAAAVVSNFFFRSFTLAPAPGLYPVPGAECCLARYAWRSSTVLVGFDAERWLVRSGVRAAEGTAGCLGVVPLPLDRSEGRPEGGGMAEAAAIASFTGERASPDWTPR
jgi:hypothetical protein